MPISDIHVEIMSDNQLQRDSKSAERVSDFLELLGNKHIDEILSLTSIKECSALELSKELNIPFGLRPQSGQQVKLWFTVREKYG